MIVNGEIYADITNILEKAKQKSIACGEHTRIGNRYLKIGAIVSLLVSPVDKDQVFEVSIKLINKEDNGEE